MSFGLSFQSNFHLVLKMLFSLLVLGQTELLEVKVLFVLNFVLLILVLLVVLEGHQLLIQ